MKIICEKKNLLESINIVLKAVPSKTTMTVLEGIYMKIQNGVIRFVTNDMEIAIETIVKGTIEEEGDIIVNAKIFSEIIRKMPDDQIIIESDENYVISIHSGKALFQINGLASEEFPDLPLMSRDNKVLISQFMLKELIRQTVFSISDNESNKLMTGELFEISGSELKVVSLDGHRISIRRMQLKESYEPMKVIIPGKTLVEISKILDGNIEDEVQVFFYDKQVLFEFDDTIVLSRLIEGEYYKIDQMLSNDYETKFVINKEQFLSCIDRATLLLKESDKKPIILDIKDGNMELKMNTKIGSMDEDIQIEKEGKDLMIAFNPKFLIDALKVIDEENISIYMINQKAPCYIKDQEENYIYLILPVNFIY